MPTMNELRAECARLGITPGRSIAECERRIAVHQVEQNDRIPKAAEAFHGGCETEVGADGVRRVTGTYTEVPGEPEAKRAEADRVAEKTARHAMAFRSGASLFLAAAAALGPVPRTSPDLREMAGSFDRAARNRPRASVPGSVRRKMQRDAAKEGR